MKLPKKEEEFTPVPLNLDRPLEPVEIEAEEKAVKLPRNRFKRIPPLPGTLGYLFRDLDNNIIFNFINNTLNRSHLTRHGTTAYKIYRVILTWNALDPNSQNRVDVWDCLCNKIGVAKDKFYAQFSEGSFNHYEAVAQRILIESKPQMLNNIRQFAGRERNFRDRELLAKANKTITDAPLIGSIDASNKTVNNNLVFESSSFRDVLRSTEKAFKEENIVEGELIEEDKPKELTEGNLENMINTEDQFSNEKLLLELERL